MAEIHINPDDIEAVIRSFKNEDETFVVTLFIDEQEQKKCTFNLSGKECKIICYIKKDGSVKIIPTGKNVHESTKLIGYIETKALNAKIATKQKTFSCSQNTFESLLEYIDTNFRGMIELEKRRAETTQIVYFLKGYNKDQVNLLFYPTTQKMTVQGKPLYVFSVILSFFAQNSDYTMDEIIDITNGFFEMNTPVSIIRSIMEEKLGAAYFYLDEALLKSISGSLSMLKQVKCCEDYTGCTTGVFKALEGYLQKLLIREFHYTLNQRSTFSMFYVENGLCEVERDTKICENHKKELMALYKIHKTKRNPFLHSSPTEGNTRIIQTLKEAEEIVEEILGKICNSYNALFSEN